MMLSARWEARQGGGAPSEEQGPRCNSPVDQCDGLSGEVVNGRGAEVRGIRDQRYDIIRDTKDCQKRKRPDRTPREECTHDQHCCTS